MATKKSVDELREPFKGSFSTFMITLIILVVGLFLPMITANGVENSRTGSGRFTPKEEVIWNLEESDDFKELAGSFVEDKVFGGVLNAFSQEQSGSKSGLWWPYHTLNAQAPNPFNHVAPINDNFVGIAKTGVWDEYVTSTMSETGTVNSVVSIHDTATSHSNYIHEIVHMFFDVNDEILVDQDATKIEIYIEFQFTAFAHKYVLRYVDDNDFANRFDIATGDVNLSSSTIIDVDTTDLIQVASRGDGYLWLQIFGTGDKYTERYTTNEVINVDVRVWGLDAKTPSLTIIGIWYIIEGIIGIFIAIIMMPNITIGGSIKSLRNIFS